MPKYNVNDIARMITEDPNVFSESGVDVSDQPPAPMVSRYDNGGGDSSDFKIGKRPGETVENTWIRDCQKKIEAIMRHRLNYGTEGDRQGKRIPDDIAKAIPFFAKTCAIYIYRDRGRLVDLYNLNGYTFFGPGEGQNHANSDAAGNPTPEKLNEAIFDTILDGFRFANRDHRGEQEPEMFKMMNRIKDYEAELDHIPNTSGIRSRRIDISDRERAAGNK